MQKDTTRAGSDERRRTPTLVLVAAGGSALTAALYFLIGFRVVTVLDDPADQTVFGLIAGAAFLASAVVLVVAQRRTVWTLGAVGLAFVIFTYFDLASERSPDFEVWGILIRVVQGVMLIALAYLALRPPVSTDDPPDGRPAAGSLPDRLMHRR